MKIIPVMATKGGVGLACLFCGAPLSQERRDRTPKFCSTKCQGKYYWTRGRSVQMAKSRENCFNLKAIPQYHPDLKPSPQLAYTAGVLCGDGSVSVRHKISLSSRSCSFAEKVSLALQKLALPAKVHVVERPSRFTGKETITYVAQVKSVLFAKWWKSLVWTEIKEIALSFPREFLEGFYESDGIASSVGFCNSNLDKLGLVRECLFSLGIESPEPKKYLEPGPGKLNKKPMYRFLLGSSRGKQLLDEISPCIKVRVL